MFELIDLKKRYGKSHWAVQGINLKIEKGQCFGLLGPNGAGKSTTIEMMEGIKSITSGQIKYDGESIGKSYKSKIGIQFQETALQDYLTVKETLQMFEGLYENTLPIETIIDWCELKEYLNQDIKKISGGQRQRMLLGVALLNDPEVLFLDEPTTGLDPKSRRNFWNLINKIKKLGKTIILTTHYMEEAYVLCDRIAIVDRGQVISEGPPKNLLEKHYSGARISLSSAVALPSDLKVTPSIQGERQEFQSQNVSETLQCLLKNNVNIDSIEIHSPTLEDLFLDLTGKDFEE